MKALLTLILSVCTLETAGALTCQSCFNDNGDDCTNVSNSNCGKNINRCFSILAFFGKGKNDASYKTWKGCEKKESWRRGTYNMTYGEDKFYYSTVQSCEGDNCNQGPIKMAPVNNTENGKECPQCYAVGKSCTPVVRKCVGLQTSCFKFHGSIFMGRDFQQLALQGCTNEHLAQQQIQPFPDSVFQEGFQLEFLH